MNQVLGKLKMFCVHERLEMYSDEMSVSAGDPSKGTHIF